MRGPRFLHQLEQPLTNQEAIESNMLRKVQECHRHPNHGSSVPEELMIDVTRIFRWKVFISLIAYVSRLRFISNCDWKKSGDRDDSNITKGAKCICEDGRCHPMPTK